MSILLLGIGKSTLGMKKLLDYLKIDHDYKEINEVREFNYTYIVKSPGISLNNPIFLKLKGLVISDIELTYLLCKPKMICITGTNGKTTVVSMIYEALRKKYKVVKCGNIGYSFPLAYLDNMDCDYFIVEMSSFELESSYYLDPEISILLNISPTHLDHHSCFNNYLYSKFNISVNQSINHYTIYNKDDIYIRKIKYLTKAKCISFSKNNTLGDIYLLDDKAYYKGKIIYRFNNEELKKDYLVYNILAVLSCLVLLNIKGYKNKLKYFTPIEYRLNKLDDYTYNDAKSTNPKSTNEALKTLKNVHLICGGYDRGTPLALELNAINNITQVYAYGESKESIVQYFKEKNIICNSYDNLSLAYDDALKNRKKEELILYSPMYPSYDQYKSYTERGEEFNRLYKEKK